MALLLKPDILTIEVNASCQLRCPTCPTTSEGYPPVVGSGYLKFEDFRKLLDENQNIREVRFESRGELFLNPDLLQILAYGYEKNVLMTNTSGVNLNTVKKEVLEGLVKYGFRHLLCSLDGASPEVYRIYRIGGDFNRVISNIKLINRYKELYHAEYPHLTWQFIVFGHNEHEILLAKKMAEGLQMSFIPKISWDADFSPIKDRSLVMATTGWSAVSREEFLESTGQHYMRNVCYALWQSPRINWDGKLLGCCWNSWGEFGSNAFSEGFIPSINNEKINYARTQLLGEAGPRDDIPCTTCDLYIKMRETSTYLSLKEVISKKTIQERMQETLEEYPVIYHLCRFVYRYSGLKKTLSRNVQ